MGMPTAREHRAADRALTQAQLDALVYNARTQTDQVAKLVSGVVNDVLSCEVITIPAAGVVSREWGTAFGSVAVTHHGGASSPGPVLVQAGGAVGDTRPAGGVATGRVNANCASTFALTGHQLAIWGTEDDVVTVQVFTGCVPPAFATHAPPPA